MKKFFAILLGALLFGTVAGGTMVGVNALSYKLYPELSEPAEAGSRETEEKETESQSGPSAEAPAPSAGTVSSPQLLDVSDIVEGAMPQVVSITNTMRIRQQGYGSIWDYIYGGGTMQEYTVPAAGSGVIVKQTDEELLILTNNHVVEDSDELSVSFIDGETVTAAIKGTDSTIDLAVVAVNLSDIKEETKEKISVAKLHDTEDLKPGQGVIAIGNALGFGQSVTVGYISALDRDIQTEEGGISGLIQVDAAINPGNSGGALINMEGEVIGINVAKLADTEVEGVGYAIPIYKAMDVIDNLSNAKTKVEIPEEEQGRLGVFVTTVNAQMSQTLNMPQGVLIAGFDDENGKSSAAKDAGLQTNDIITKFDGQSVSDAEDLTRLVKYYEAGSTVKVTYQRLADGKYEEHTAEVTLQSSEEAGSGTAEEGAQNDGAADEKNPNGDIYDAFREFLEQYQ